jgi:predicted HicB family RNase H-like nuclease
MIILVSARREGRVPEQPFSGSFNVRTGTDGIATLSYSPKSAARLNRVVSEALTRYLQQRTRIMRSRNG